MPCVVVQFNVRTLTGPKAGADVDHRITFGSINSARACHRELVRRIGAVSLGTDPHSGHTTVLTSARILTDSLSDLEGD